MKRLFFLFTLVLLFISCGEHEEVIPKVSFSVTIDLTDPRYSSQSTFIVKRGIDGARAGINGVVVYRMSSDTYYAFDLMCPKEKQFHCLVDIKDDVTCECSHCGSQFLIAVPYGDVISGPSPWPLQGYKTQVTGGGTILNIWN